MTWLLYLVLFGVGLVGSLYVLRGHPLNALKGAQVCGSTQRQHLAPVHPEIEHLEVDSFPDAKKIGQLVEKPCPECGSHKAVPPEEVPFPGPAPCLRCGHRRVSGVERVLDVHEEIRRLKDGLKACGTDHLPPDAPRMTGEVKE